MVGPLVGGSDLAMNFLAHLAKCMERADSLKWALRISAEKYYTSWKAFQNIMQRSWWRRAWVIQEVALAKEVEFACGERTLSETQFIRVNNFLSKYWPYIFPRQRSRNFD